MKLNTMKRRERRATWRRLNDKSLKAGAAPLAEQARVAWCADRDGSLHQAPPILSRLAFELEGIECRTHYRVWTEQDDGALAILCSDCGKVGSLAGETLLSNLTSNTPGARP